jgi:hemerythrin superfamily protein|tara:strand:+ start:993 stop:1298 length:306 start_codon:yes stop_codon:yes gene_type:complete
MREPSDDWQDQYQSQFMTIDEEIRYQHHVESTMEDDFQGLLEEAMAPQNGWNMRAQDIAKLLEQIRKDGDYSALGEYLYLLAHDEALERVAREITFYDKEG